MRDKELRGIIARVLALALAFAAIGGLLGQGLQAHPGVAVLTLAALIFGAGTLTDWGRTLLPNDTDTPGTVTSDGRAGQRVTCDFGHRATVWVTDGPLTPRRLSARPSRTRIELQTPDPACPSCQQLQREFEAALAHPRKQVPPTAPSRELPADGRAGQRVTCDFGHRATVRLTDDPRTPRRLSAHTSRTRIELQMPDAACPSCQQLQREFEAALAHPRKQVPPAAPSRELPADGCGVPGEGDLLGPDNDAPTCRFGHRVTVETVYEEPTSQHPPTRYAELRIKLLTQDPACPGCQWLRQYVESALQQIQEQESSMAETEARSPTPRDVPAETGETGAPPPAHADAPAETGVRPPTPSDVPAEHPPSRRDNDTPICDFGHRVTVGLVYGEPTAVDLATGKISTRVELVTPDGSCPGCRRLHYQLEDALRAARERGSLATPVQASLTQASDVDISLD